MKLTNTDKRYGWTSIGLHWLIAIGLIGLFTLGLWMVDLSFYSPWYHDAPAIHKSVGVLLVGFMVLRLIWRWSNPIPQEVSGQVPFLNWVAHSVHILFYVLVLALGVSGYLISTAEGHGIEVFNWFTLPAVGLKIEEQADTAGEIHFWLAWTLIGFATIHALAALKHHFINKDKTLKRMLTPRD
ncbi:cytochrome b [Hydrogenovibrio sp. 3SP14C1]|uniref:cytochrome b n=1 Tax=Hydrogenovibrio sp. 3SP14C1 TaxID=3038774 RepID=UPI00241612E5|nr:cytochrome b [Hydrogenovibrio sp. 3SP14C1]MDG4813134.1 cytochrome b [Hydrogenovibrio sp. 3SP14C1]